MVWTIGAPKGDTGASPPEPPEPLPPAPEPPAPVVLATAPPAPPSPAEPPAPPWPPTPVVAVVAAPPVPLVNGIALVNQHAAQNEQLFYTLDVPSGAIDLHFETSGNVANQDADLTIKFDGQVICQSAGAADEEACDFPSPAPGTYTAIVDAYTTLTNFTILGRYTAPVDGIFANGFD